jgi:glycosyltransferase involved in cell wall biosynthesis
MVAAEAAACGVLPIVPAHSGIAEAAEAIEERLGVPGFLSYEPGRPIEGIAAGIDRILSLDPTRRSEMGTAASALARERWSWEHVAKRLLDAAV